MSVDKKTRRLLHFSNPSQAWQETMKTLSSSTFSFSIWFSLLKGLSGSLTEFDPNDCYEPGTIFEENEKNLGFCPCKYGYFGPLCFDIYDCVIGNLRTDNCSRDYQNDYDLQWRCAASKKNIVKICTCPAGFRGETCEYILENTIETYWKTVEQSQKFFEIVYNNSHSVVRLVGTKVCRTMNQYRRMIMMIIFIAIFIVVWKQHKRNIKREMKYRELRDAPPKYECSPNNRKLDIIESGEIVKVKIREPKDSDAFHTVSEVKQESEEAQRLHKPCLHI
ncbi:unnamed protein product [Caenorhabditis sp. 36 PRJEB53466]|nr:unnamed protein product [Caenorhabditis sp. 36 PRJEB53466]